MSGRVHAKISSFLQPLFQLDKAIKDTNILIQLISLIEQFGEGGVCVEGENIN